MYDVIFTTEKLLDTFRMCESSLWQELTTEQAVNYNNKYEMLLESEYFDRLREEDSDFNASSYIYTDEVVIQDHFSLKLFIEELLTEFRIDIVSLFSNNFDEIDEIIEDSVNLKYLKSRDRFKISVYLANDLALFNLICCEFKRSNNILTIIDCDYSEFELAAEAAIKNSEYNKTYNIEFFSTTTDNHHLDFNYTIEAKVSNHNEQFTTFKHNFEKTLHLLAKLMQGEIYMLTRDKPQRYKIALQKRENVLKMIAQMDNEDYIKDIYYAVLEKYKKPRNRVFAIWFNESLEYDQKKYPKMLRIRIFKEDLWIQWDLANRYSNMSDIDILNEKNLKGGK